MDTGSISGTVTDLEGAAVAGVDVSVVDADGATKAAATTGSQGGYTVPGLPAGTYSVSVAPEGADPVFWPDATTLGDAQTIEVADAAAVTGIDIVTGAKEVPAPNPTEPEPEVSPSGAAFEAKAEASVGTYTVTVHVTDEGGLPMEMAYVSLAGDSASFWGRADSFGRVTLSGVPADGYGLIVYPFNAEYASQWRDLNVTGDTAVDVILQRPATISGHVLSTGSGDIDVRLLRVEDLQLSTQRSVVDGAFTLDHVAPGQYFLEASPRSGSDAPTLYPGVFDPRDATVVTVGSGGSVQGIDFSLAAGHSISGKVTGGAASYAQVKAVSAPIEWNGKRVFLWSQRGYASADRDGNYTLRGLADGQYTVSASGFGVIEGHPQWVGPYYEGYYLDSPTPSGATPIPVRGQNQSAIDISLFGQGTASGNISAEGGTAPLENTLITAYRWTGANWDETLSDSGWGRYSLGMHLSGDSYGLPQGTYTIRFSDPDAVYGDDGIDYPYCTEYWSGKNTLGLADRFEVTAGEDTPGIDATLRLKSGGCAADVVNPGAPTIVGTPQVGAPVGADPGSWAPQPIQLAYQWRANGVDIDGAISRIFTPTAEQAGKKLTVAVTGSRPGFESATVVSPESAVVGAGAAGTIQAGRPTLSGPALSGVPLVVSPGDWAPQPVDLTYRWWLDDRPIDGATGAAYTPTAAEVGGHLTVAVTGTKTGYTPATVIVDAGTVSASIALDSSSALPGGAIVVTGRGYDPGETVRVELHSTVLQLGTTVADADGSFRLPTTLPLTAIPGDHRVFGIGERSGREASAPMTIGSPSSVGDKAVSTPTRTAPALAATGTTVPVALTVLGILLAVGGALLLWRTTRRRV
ncbi:carboxypeptidase regulatory-like domain-containing protein [Microbacterium sp. SLBN-111]|uniref:carboxypeptidase regulatory-like domain-containing protein n=1 Tax=Microbacterium sp. SLBN-111 TaxID=3377733 RepID=UPI003C70900B